MTIRDRRAPLERRQPCRIDDKTRGQRGLHQTRSKMRTKPATPPLNPDEASLARLTGSPRDNLSKHRQPALFQP